MCEHSNPRPTAKDISDSIQPGLIIRVLPSGRKEFAIRYRTRGRRRRLKLGVYPSVTLHEARVRARRALSVIDDGGDPVAEQQAARVVPRDTVAALVEDYLTRHARKFKRSAAEDERVLKADVVPTLGDRAVRELTRRDIRALLDRVVDRGAPVAANRLLAVVRKMLNFAVDRDWLEANPAARITKPTREVSRERVLSDEEIRRLWRLLSRQPTTPERAAPGRKRSKGTADDPICPVTPPLAAAIKMRLLTAQRGGEVIKMRWQDVDLEAGWWTIPGEDSKNGRAHRVPLVPDAIAIIKAQQKDVDEQRKDPNEDPDDGEENDYVFVGAGASLRDRAKKAPSKIARRLNMEFRGHDLRRTAATKMAESGVPRHHISAVLNHVEGSARATRVYDRYSYDSEKRVALETWARKLQSIVEQLKSGKLLPFGSATR